MSLPAPSMAATATGGDTLRRGEALQQPDWDHHPSLPAVRAELASAPPLVRMADIHGARDALARVAYGDALLLQLGDCAESFYECGPARGRLRTEMIDGLADRLARGTGTEVVRFGRLGGQFAKPRSSPTERHGDHEIPVFRGHMVNSETPSRAARRPDPRRMLWAYQASARVLADLRAYTERARQGGAPPAGPWASHEALVLDYESPLVRTDRRSGRAYLMSTHLPWIGERTRRPDHAHVRMLAQVGNPVACKIGPTAEPDEVTRLCALLDPGREPGRLTLIVRMGRTAIADALPPIVRAVRAAGHPVVWLSDPMHGNTVKTGSGVKTRHLADIVAEAAVFRDVVAGHGEHPAGLHLEVACTDVTECVGGPVGGERDLAQRYHTLCDPRLNPAQAAAVIDTLTG